VIVEPRLVQLLNGAKVSVISDWSVKPGISSSGDPCSLTQCTFVAGVMPVCYRPSGWSTITAKDYSSSFVFATANVGSGLGFAPVVAGSSVGVFSSLAPGNYDFGLGGNNMGRPNSMVFTVERYNVVVVVHP